MTILGIETSCDETAVGICRIDSPVGGVTVLANTLVSQIDIHTAYGGVVPEVAARSHIEAMIPVLDEALKAAFGDIGQDAQWAQIDAIAVTQGAGLGGSLLIGVMTARTLAIAKNKPLYACNHVIGHVYANFITSHESRVMSREESLKTEDIVSTPGNQKVGALVTSSHVSDIGSYSLPSEVPNFPLLALIVSGKHSQLVVFKDHFDYEVLGVTFDDAIGEAFDKVAKMTGLPYPGGPSVAKAAKLGNDRAFDLPKARMGGEYDFSFSGLKTAVLRRAQFMCGRDHTMHSTELPESLSEAQVNDIAATFQRVAIETLVDKAVKAYHQYSPDSVVIAGGVASSAELRRQLKDRLPIDLIYTDARLCTDNGAMIASLGCYMATLGVGPVDPYSLEIQPNLKM